MYPATVPWPTAVGPASTMSLESGSPCRVVGRSERKSRRRSRWCRPSPPRRLDGDISRRWMMRCIFVTPIAGMLTRSSVTRRRPSTPTGSLIAAPRTSSAVRSPVATCTLTLARARRAATAARDAATLSTSGGVGRFSATDGSYFSHAARNRIREPDGAGRKYTTGFTHDNASGVFTIYRCLLYTSDAADDLLCVDLGG